MKNNRSLMTMLASLHSSIASGFRSPAFRRIVGAMLVVANLTASSGILLAVGSEDAGTEPTSFVNQVEDGSSAEPKTSGSGVSEDPSITDGQKDTLSSDPTSDLKIEQTQEPKEGPSFSSEPSATKLDTAPSSPETKDETVLAFTGDDYSVTVSYGPETGIPQDAQLAVREIYGNAEYDTCCDQIAEVMDTKDVSYLRFFDISILSGGVTCEPSAGTRVSVKITLNDSPEGELNVLHLPDDEETSFVDKKVTPTSEGTEVLFEADGFSAYAIVAGPGEVPVGWTQVTTVEQVRERMSAGKGLYLSMTGCYFSNQQGDAGSGQTGIVRIKTTQAYPTDTAAEYFFEPVPDSQNEFYIYCLNNNGDRQYVKHGPGDHSLSFSETEKTPFTLTWNNGKKAFQLVYNGEYWNRFRADGGTCIATWNSVDDNTYLKMWYYEHVETDPYNLDGKTYGLMSYPSGVNGKAMMAESNSAGNGLEAKLLTVMANKSSHNDKLFVPKDSDITMWSFEWQGGTEYHISAEVDGVKKYMNISGSGVTLSDSPVNVKVIPGNGTNSGTISLEANGYTIGYTGNLENGFKTGGSDKWLSLVRLGELTSSYYIVHSADRVSVSDTTQVRDGQKVVIYTRIWNETTKNYEFYAVDGDGSLVRCYPEGSRIEWVGSPLNTLLWDFVEYTGEDGQPNQYYELYNEYSEKYIAPQLNDGQTLSDSPLGIHLPGRTAKEYSTKIHAWDEDQYNYARVKTELQYDSQGRVTGGRIVSEPLPVDEDTTDERADFYFAIITDLFEEPELHDVETVNNDDYGITMRMVDFGNVSNNRSQDQIDTLGNTNYTNGNPTQGLLADHILEGENYPRATTPGAKTFEELYNLPSARDVNHLFVKSVYETSGYFEFDSSQNYARLQDNGDFAVYQELVTSEEVNQNFLRHGQFFPYNDIKRDANGNLMFSTANPENVANALGRVLPETDPRKYEKLFTVGNKNEVNFFFGMEISSSFVQTPNGLDDWGHDIIYEFSGDDDFWLYVDGELVIDLGGIHDAISGSVNYRTGEVVVNGKETTLYDTFKEHYLKPERGMTEDEVNAKLQEIFKEHTKSDGSSYWTFQDYTSHTMKIYYMERGSGASNLHMRFNQSSVRKGTVILGKEISGADQMETYLAEFPYQIYYMVEGGAEQRLTQTDSDIAVYYKGTTRPVKYADSYTIGGVTYNDVFFLKPGELCEIKVPDDTISYRIIECGVDDDIYNEVYVNGVKIENPDPLTEETRLVFDRGNGRYDYAIPPQKVSDRTSVRFVNHVDPEALRTITIKKRVFDEAATHELEPEETFNIRVYLDFESQDTSLDPVRLKECPADMYVYHVKDEDGNYCKYDTSLKKFVKLGDGKTDFTQLTQEEKRQSSFRTSIYGAISKIPVKYTVELREVLVGTKYMIEERDNEVPDGYSLHGYRLSTDGSELSPDDTTPVTGQLTSYSATDPYSLQKCPRGIIQKAGSISGEQDPHVDVVNLKGWGYRIYKEWNDEDYMSDRAPAYFAIYADGQMVEGTVRQLVKGNDSLYWYFPLLKEGVDWSQYDVREVTISNSTPTIENGIVTDPGTVTPIEQDGKVTLMGTMKGASSAIPCEYTVTYDHVNQDSNHNNIQTVKIKNTRPGFEVRKTDWDGHPLSGAQFTLTDKEANIKIGPFSSDDTGYVTTAFLRENVDYQLEETLSPHGYQGIPATATIRKNTDGTISVSGLDQEYYVKTDDAITLKNRPYTFTVTKLDENGDPLADALFALHKVKNVNGVVSEDPLPLPGYENLRSGPDGGIPELNSTLLPGTYVLRETKAPDGFQKLKFAVEFVVEKSGGIRLNGTYLQDVEFISPASANADGEMEYELRLTNHPLGSLQITKEVAGSRADVSQKFDFTITLKDSDGLPLKSVRVKQNSGNARNQGLNAQGSWTFKLAHGETVEFIDLDKETAYTVSENNLDYDAGYKLNGAEDRVTGNTVSGKVGARTELEFINKKNGLIPTGLQIPVRTILGAVLVFALGSGVFFVRGARRNKDEEDDNE
ncbi:MAG: DUF5979 domain-containing protein [Clostridiales bacterium]|nr:DUF5979 domain-containing protein [Clostridiales bacterium]